MPFRHLKTIETRAQAYTLGYNMQAIPIHTKHELASFEYIPACEISVLWKDNVKIFYCPSCAYSVLFLPLPPSCLIHISHRCQSYCLSFLPETLSVTRRTGTHSLRSHMPPHASFLFNYSIVSSLVRDYLLQIFHTQLTRRLYPS